MKIFGVHSTLSSTEQENHPESKKVFVSAVIISIFLADRMITDVT